MYHKLRLDFPFSKLDLDQKLEGAVTTEVHLNTMILYADTSHSLITFPCISGADLTIA